MKHRETINNYEETYGFLDEELRSLRNRSDTLIESFGTTAGASMGAHRGLPSPGADENNRALIFNASGDIETAVNSIMQSIGIQEKAFPPDHPSLSISNHNLSILFEELGNMGKSLEHEWKAVAIREKCLPSNHPSLIASYRHLSSLYRSLGEDEKAREYALKAESAVSSQSLPEK